VYGNFWEAICDEEKELRVLGGGGADGRTLEELLLEHRQKIIRLYIDALSDTDEDVRLASQVVDYLEENILIKRDAYDRMSREHLFKQIKNKVLKD
jgi:hypothetical protein